MHIVVPIKQVPETNAVRMDEDSGTMIREGVEGIVNPLDLYAIEAAIRLAERHGGQTTAISMGPPRAVTALREALAMGIDSAVLISDKAFAGSDTWATSYVLAQAIRKLCCAEALPVGPGAAAPPTGAPPPALPDLIICGERATDGDTGQVGPGIASWLDLPVASYVGRIDQVADGRCTVRRLVEDGHEVLDVQLPAVLTVVKEVADPRLPTLNGKLRAQSANIPTWTPADLDVDPAKIGLEGSPTRVVKIFRPKVARQCEKVLATDEQTLADAVDRLVEFLRLRQVPQSP